MLRATASRVLQSHARCYRIVQRCSLSTTAAAAAKLPTIGFIGLGNMGASMALNLHKHGFPIIVTDAVPAAVTAFTNRAAAIATATTSSSIRTVSKPHELVGDVDVIVTMLPSSPHVREVYLGDSDSSSNSNTSLLSRVAASKRKVLLIDSSTIDPQTSRDVYAEAHKQGATMVDAPVSGGINGAAAGTLTFMIGGSASEFTAASAVLQHMGRNLVHCGDSGTGQVAKVCNNLSLGIQMVATAEAMNLGIKLGMDAKILASIFNTSSARCWSSDTYNPVPSVLPNVPASNNYDGGFGTALMLKDIGLALTAAQTAGVHLQLGEVTNRVYADVCEAGHGRKDFGIVYQHLKAEGEKPIK